MLRVKLDVFPQHVLQGLRKPFTKKQTKDQAQKTTFGLPLWTSGQAPLSHPVCDRAIAVRMCPSVNGHLKLHRKECPVGAETFNGVTHLARTLHLHRSFEIHSRGNP
jgi:hypothetical protein